MDSRHRLTRALVLLILVAALGTAPVFLFAEGFGREHVLRVLASNGVCALLCAGLLARLRRGDVEWTARILVFGLLALVSWLAWSNGEVVHVNVINFVLVTVLAATLLSRGALLVVGSLVTIAMISIAWKAPLLLEGKGMAEARFESIAQFLPTYLVVVLVLWLREAGRQAG